MLYHRIISQPLPEANRHPTCSSIGIRPVPNDSSEASPLLKITNPQSLDFRGFERFLMVRPAGIEYPPFPAKPDGYRLCLLPIRPGSASSASSTSARLLPLRTVYPPFEVLHPYRPPGEEFLALKAWSERKRGELLEACRVFYLGQALYALWGSTLGQPASLEHLFDFLNACCRAEGLGLAV